MRREKRQRLEAAAWKVGSAEPFVGLTDEEASFVAVRVALALLLKESRIERH